MLKWHTAILDKEILCHYLCLLLLPEFMKSKFVILVNHMLNQALSYISTILQCRPITYDGRTSIGEKIAKMTVDNIKKAIQEEENHKKDAKHQRHPSKWSKKQTFA